jgi:outer membrane lipoprotein-sorting protein
MVKRIALAIIILVLAGCVKGPQVAPPIERTKEDLLQSINRSHERLKSIGGKGKVAVSAGKETYKGDFNLLYQNPRKLKLDMYGPFGLHMLALSEVEDTLLVFLPTVNVAFSSTASKVGVEGLMDVVTVNELRELLAGTMSLPENIPPDEVLLKPKDKLVSLIFDADGYTNEVVLNPRTEVMVARDIYDKAGNLLLQCSYSRFKAVDKIPRPYLIEISETKSGNHLELQYESQSLNMETKDTDFHLDIPEGIGIIQN